MAQNSQFRAPWGMALKLMTSILTLILVGVPCIGLLSGARDMPYMIMMIVIPLLILFVFAFFIIRGYVLTSETLVIKRLGWTSKVDLKQLTSVEVDPDAMSKSLRTCGNGGLFCFAGLFWNKKLGSYRAFATDPKRSVILTFADRTVVVTPDNPEAFAAKIKRMKHL